MDPDIQFGEVEEEKPDIALRPDRNRHFAVCPYEAPAEGELPVFVDLDVLIEMESHALTDTSVELGGVMLGGQLYDEQQQPYVLVTDSLRAQHYEATKGSFKFTHDTWQQITRERDDFPDDWQMVGWYHTHPDWGVFLSGMDMFICDHFFNKPLDVALVIDPCRQDRGFFQWTGDESERVRRLSGFFVISSRFRQAELEQFVAELESGDTMRTDPQMRGSYGVNSSGGPTVVNITEKQQPWMAQAVMGTLMLQVLFMGLIAYGMFFYKPQQAAVEEAPKLSREEKLAAKTAVLDEVIARMEGGTKNVVSQLHDSREEKLLLEAQVDGMTRGHERIKKDLEAQQKKVKKLSDNVASLEKKRKEVRESWLTAREKADKLEEQLKKLNKKEGDTKPPWYAFLFEWQGILVGGLLLADVAGSVGVAVGRASREEENAEAETGSDAEDSDVEDRDDQEEYIGPPAEDDTPNETEPK